MRLIFAAAHDHFLAVAFYPFLAIPLPAAHRESLSQALFPCEAVVVDVTGLAFFVAPNFWRSESSKKGDVFVEFRQFVGSGRGNGGLLGLPRKGRQDGERGQCRDDE